MLKSREVLTRLKVDDFATFLDHASRVGAGSGGRDEGEGGCEEERGASEEHVEESVVVVKECEGGREEWCEEKRERSERESWLLYSCDDATELGPVCCSCTFVAR